ncbi:MAG: hypothetical protein ABIZ95_20745 [Pyrinomonadaceae bacterium]
MNVLGGGSGGAIPLGGGGGGGILGMLGQGGGGIGGGLLGGFFGGGAAAASAATAGLSATSIGAGAVNTVSGGLPALTTGGAGGAGLMGSMGALFTNPWTAVVAGGIVASLLLYRHFAHRTEKKLRETIQSTYGVAVKDMAVLKQVKEVGEQRFGKGQVSKHLLETVKLDPAKQIILGYAESTGQQANGLVTEAQYKDPGFAGNRFITRLSGGMIPGARRGFDHVPVLADGGEFMMRSSVSSREGADRLQALNEGRASIALPGDGGSSRGGGDSQVMAMATNMLAAVATGLAQFSAVMERFGSMSPDDLLTMQADGNPATFGRATVRAMDEDYSIQDKFFRTTK